MELGNLYIWVNLHNELGARLFAGALIVPNGHCSNITRLPVWTQDGSILRILLQKENYLNRVS